MEPVTTIIVFLVVLTLWVLPIILGIKVAIKKNRSPHWMWFGVHPVGGWITLIVLCNAAKLKKCSSCGETVKTYAKVCPYCNNAFPENTITIPKAKKSPLVPILIVISCIFLFIFFIFSMATNLFRSSISYKQTLEILNSNETIINELGLPIKSAGFISGSINTDNADYSITVKGPKNKARVYIKGIYDSGKWSFTNLTIKLKDGSILDLVQK